MITEIRYGLMHRSTGQLAEFNVNMSDDGQVEETYELVAAPMGEDGQWLVETPELAGLCSLRPSGEYNDPILYINKNEYQVVQVIVTTEIRTVF